MQSRHRSSGGNGFRSYGSSYRSSFGRRGFDSPHSYSKPPPPPPSPPPPPPRSDILLQAGRLAAEYLVSKGLLPANLLPDKLQGRGSQELKPAEREQDGRKSALSRLGSSASDSGGNGRKRFHSDYSSMGSRRGRRRYPFDRGYSPEFDREGSRNERRRSRGRMEEDEEFSPSYHRYRRSGFGGSDDVGSSSFSRSAVDALDSGAENCEVTEDTGSKASSSSTKKEAPPETDAELSRGETVEEDEEGEESLSVVVGNEDLSKLCSFFPMVPTRPRSALAQQRNVKPGRCHSAGRDEGDLQIQACAVVAEEEEEVTKGGPLVDLSTSSMEPQVCNAMVSEQLESATELEDAEREVPRIVQVTEEAAMVEGKEASFERMESAYAGTSEGNESPNIHSSPEKQYFERKSSEYEAANTVEHYPNGAYRCPDVESGDAVESEEVARSLPCTSFKICDLNLMDAPGLCESDIADDPAMGDLVTSPPAVKTEKEVLTGYGFAIGDDGRNANAVGQVSYAGTVVEVIDLEDDSPSQEKHIDTSKPKNETMYSGMDAFLSNADQVDGPSSIQDGYSLAFTELIRSDDIHGCPSVQGDPSNLQGSMDLHGAEGVPEDDDPIYCLGEFPLGFMEAWDQPTQGFGKFF